MAPGAMVLFIAFVRKDKEPIYMSMRLAITVFLSMVSLVKNAVLGHNFLFHNVSTFSCGTGKFKFFMNLNLILTF